MLFIAIKFLVKKNEFDALQRDLQKYQQIMQTHLLLNIWYVFSPFNHGSLKYNGTGTFTSIMQFFFMRLDNSSAIRFDTNV